MLIDLGRHPDPKNFYSFFLNWNEVLKMRFGLHEISVNPKLAKFGILDIRFGLHKISTNSKLAKF